MKFNQLKKIALLTMLVGGTFVKAKAQAMYADPAIEVVTGTVAVGNTMDLLVRASNLGVTPDEDSIVANSLVVTVSITSYAEITGVNTATSSSRWTVISLTTGPGNTIKLKNNATLAWYDNTDIHLNVKGITVVPNSVVLGNISYLPGINPILGTPSASQGDNDIVNNNGQSGFAVTPNPLPVTLSSFTANAAPGKCAAQLLWSTGSEKNFDHFTVQYSTDGTSFQSAGSVKSNGNVLGSTYNYSMQQPADRTYYRLQMVDKDGATEYSKTQPVFTHCDDNGLAATWSVYPNPAQTGSNAHLQYVGTNNNQQSLKVIVSDLMGRRMWASDLKATAGNNVYTMPSANWAPGTYFVNLYSQDGAIVNQTQKLILN